MLYYNIIITYSCCCSAANLGENIIITVTVCLALYNVVTIIYNMYL